MEYLQQQQQFLSPIQRVELDYTKSLAQLRLQENADLTANIKFSERCESIVKHYNVKRNQLLIDKRETIDYLMQITKKIGNGCECGKPQRSGELEDALLPYLPLAVCNVIIDYLPNGTPRLVFSKQQLFILKTIASGVNIFFTGRAGTGKSLIVSTLRKINLKNIYFTAMTGVAASNIQGMTFHSFCGIGMYLIDCFFFFFHAANKNKCSKQKQVFFFLLGQDDEKDAEELVKKIKFSHETKQRWLHCECLFVDEVSMLSRPLFEKVDYLARTIRKNEKPFGGIQLVFVGDFLQLGPIVNNRNKTCKKDNENFYCFQSELWNKCFSPQNCFELTASYRQRDNNFITLLDEVRKGQISNASAELLRNLKRPLCVHDGVLPTQLRCLNEKVDAINRQHMLALKREIVTFQAIEEGSPSNLVKLEKTCLVEKRIELCIGAQVMLLVNLNTQRGLVNGSRGVITAFTKDRNPIVQFTGMSEPLVVSKFTWFIFNRKRVAVASRQQIPLKLAFATTIHKSQGLTLNKVSVDLAGFFFPLFF